MKSDIEIAQSAKMEPIINIAKKIGLGEDDIELYGKYKCKISLDAIKKLENNKDGKLVLVTAINALIVGYIIFWDRLSEITFSTIDKIKNSDPYLIFLVLIFVSITTLIVKAIFGEGTPLKGGMPSGHSAIAFSIATTIALITEEPISVMLSYLLALIVAQSRVDSEVHSVLEVIVGAIFGTLLTVAIFKFLSIV